MPYWHLNTIAVDAMHRAGHTGKGVKLAILDSLITLPRMVTWQESDVDAPDGHANRLAALIRGHGNMPGVAPDATLESFPSLFNGTSLSVYAKSMYRALDRQPDIILMSSGAYLDDGFDDDGVMSLGLAIEEAQRRGVIVVASSGNEPCKVSFPAVLSGAHDVGSLTKFGRRAEHSPECSWAAPGENIRVPHELLPISGTSYAAPIHAASLALIISMVREQGRELTPFILNMMSKRTPAGRMLHFSSRLSL